MARYRAEIETQLPQDQVFAYLSDFANSAEWDPGVVAAERLGETVGKGTEFRLVVSFLGREVPIHYRAVDFDPPRSVLFVGENGTAVSRDRITVIGTSPHGAQVSYDAELRLKGALQIFDPLLRLVFKRVGDRARAGLRQALDRRPGTDQEAA